MENVEQIHFKKIDLNNTFLELSEEFSILYDITQKEINPIKLSRNGWLPDFPWYVYLIGIVLILSLISKTYKYLMKKLF